MTVIPIFTAGADDTSNTSGAASAVGVGKRFIFDLFIFNRFIYAPLREIRQL